MFHRRWGIEKPFEVGIGDQDTRVVALKARLENSAEEWQLLCHGEKRNGDISCLGADNAE